MPTSSRLRARSLPASLLLAAAAVAASGCAAATLQDPPPAAVAAAEPAPEPEPEPEPPPPVEGELTDVVTSDTSIRVSGLYPPGAPQSAEPSVDRAAVDATAEATVAWLDAHLQQLQDDRPGRVEAADLIGDAAPLGPGLASADDPVAHATYRLAVGTRELPEYVRATVVVDRASGTRSAATFVFVPVGDDVELVAVLPADATADGDPSERP